MVTAAKPWLICDKHGIAICFLFVVKPWLIFTKEVQQELAKWLQSLTAALVTLDRKQGVNYNVKQ